MSDSQTLEFGAILSISMPEGVGHTDFHVFLASTDLIVGDSGVLKPLGDCTLAELRQFAQDFESEVWSTYESMTLFDLVVDGQATISLLRVEDDESGSSPVELTLEHLIVFPGDDLADEAGADIVDRQADDLDRDIEAALAEVDESVNASESESIPEDPKIHSADTPVTISTAVRELEAALEDLEELIDTKAVARTTEKAVVPNAEEIVADEAEEVDEELLPGLSVAQTEPVHLDKEIPAEIAKPIPDIVEKRPLFRLLGKRRPLNHSTWTAVDILISERAFRAAQVHANSSLDREVAGVLFGPHPEKQPDGRYVVHVSDAIIAKHTRMHGASVTYTPESWRYVNDRLAELYPNDDAVIVGWYHTHPGFGIFLSGMDQFIHQNFFTQIWHIALVLDPLAQRSGFFCWDRRLSKVDKYDFPWPAWASSSW